VFSSTKVGRFLPFLEAVCSQKFRTVKINGEKFENEQQAKEKLNEGMAERARLQWRDLLLTGSMLASATDPELT
jgi:hypothetical protein